MSKKIFITLILIALISLVFGVWFLMMDKNPNDILSQTDGENLFPFGQGGGTTPVNPGTTNQTTTTTPGLDLNYIPRLRKISETPVAGGVVFTNKLGTIIRYVERATGHIFETYTDSLEIKRISNTTIPKIEEALWSNQGNQVLFRYLRDDNQTIRTFYARISTTTVPDQAIEGIFLPDNIAEINVFGDRIFYTAKTETGSTGIIANIDGTKKTALINSSFNTWSHTWSQPGSVLLFPSPSSLATGFIYTLNTTSGEYIKVSQGAPGLSGLSNKDGSLILMSGKKGFGVGTAVLNTKTGETTNLSLQTMTDKCVWSVLDATVLYCAISQALPQNNYPDAWYQGKVTTNDSVWKINTETGDTEEILSPQIEALEEFDITNLSLDAQENVLLFTNKKDLTLWAYSLRL